MNRLVILPYKMSSKSSKALARHFDVKRVYPNRHYRPRNGDVVLNWGYCGVAPVLEAYNRHFTVINQPIACDRASDKIATLRCLKQANVPHVDFFLNKEAAIQSVEEGNMIYCRTLTRGREGQGIVLATNVDEVVDARLYIKYFKNDMEFRIHVFMGNIIDMVQKKKMSKERMAEFGLTEADLSQHVRNMKKGWSFCRKDVVVPDIVKEVSIEATKALGLDFAAVDIAYNSETNECKVLELNTAPGQGEADGRTIGNTTHMRYVRAITEKLLNKEFSLEEYNQRYND